MVELSATVGCKSFSGFTGPPGESPVKSYNRPYDGGQRGFVDDITLRYTKIFTMDNTFLVIPNGTMQVSLVDDGPVRQGRDHGADVEPRPAGPFGDGSDRKPPEGPAATPRPRRVPMTVTVGETSVLATTRGFRTAHDRHAWHGTDARSEAGSPPGRSCSSLSWRRRTRFTPVIRSGWH